MKSVIFFLAHDGIKQLNVWKTWLEMCNAVKETVIVRIFCNEGKVTDPYFTRSIMPFQLATKWAGSSLVLVLQLGYRYILETIPDFDMIFLVSGYDIPTMSPGEFKKLDKSRSYIPLQDLDRMPAKVYKTLDIYEVSRTQPKYSSVQWIHVIREHAQKIADANLDTFIQWLDFFNAYHKQNYVYDEVLPCAMLHAAGTNMATIIDEPLTDMERKNCDDPSPINFDSLDKRYTICLEDSNDDLEEGEISSKYLSLREVLKVVRQQEFVFFRKVTSSVVFDKMPWLD